MKQKIAITGTFGVIYCDPDGSVGWRRELANGVTLVGCDRMNRRMFLGASSEAPTGWKIGVISGSGFTGVSSGDTHGSHSGWTEFTGYSGGLRRDWSPYAAVGGVISGVGTQFSITSPGLVRGLILASKAVPDLDPLAILYSTAVADANLSVSNGGTLYVTYTSRVRNQ